MTDQEAWTDLTFDTKSEHRLQALISGAICHAARMGHVRARDVAAAARLAIEELYPEFSEVSQERLEAETGLLVRLLFDKPTKDLFVTLSSNVESLCNRTEKRH